MADNPFNKLPPQDLDAERAVLGSIMIDDRTLDEVAGVIKPEHFYLDAHGVIFASMLEMRDSGKAIDGLTVSSHLERGGRLEEVGGDKYLTQCVNSIPHAAHAKHHAQEIHDRWSQRQLIYACTEFLSEAYGGHRTGSELASLLIDKASDVSDNGTRAGCWLRDVAMGAMERHLATDAEGISTGFGSIDAFTGGLKAAELTIIAGRPSMGKTSIAANVCEHVARAGHVVAFFSLEMRNDEILDRMVLRPVGTSRNQLKAVANENPDLVQDAVNQIGMLPVYINDKASQSVATITAECRTIKRTRGLSLVIVDYLQLIEPEDKRAPREQQVGQISWRLKQLAKTLDVPVICLSQLSRACESRPDKKPIMADLRDSGQVEQNADSIWFPFRPAVYFPDDHPEHAVELLIPKNRAGRPGVVNMLWDGPTMTFSEFKEEQTWRDPFDGEAPHGVEF